MGKSVLPYSQMLDRMEAEIRPFRRALRTADKARFDRLFTMARKHVPSGVMQSDPDPWRTATFAILIELLRMIDDGARDTGPFV